MITNAQDLSNNPNVLPCSLCEEIGEVSMIHNTDTKEVCVCCAICGFDSIIADSEELAIQLWNAQSTKLTAQYAKSQAAESKEEQAKIWEEYETSKETTNSQNLAEKFISSHKKLFHNATTLLNPADYLEAIENYGYSRELDKKGHIGELYIFKDGSALLREEDSLEIRENNNYEF